MYASLRMTITKLYLLSSPHAVIEMPDTETGTEISILLNVNTTFTPSTSVMATVSSGDITCEYTA